MRKTASTVSTALLATTALTNAASAQDADQTDFSVTDEIIVRGVNIPDEKRATSEISSVLTPERLERQGDSDIAEALRRVTGLSLSEGRFIVVRGLNERYSNLTLNGSPLPSPEPLRRVAPLDLFPVSVVDTALVQKTFSPEYSGEFGGGLIELRSKALPDEGFFEVSVSGEIDTATTASDGLTYDGGGRDWTGFDDGTRDIPQPLQDATLSNIGVAVRADTGVFDEATVREIGASFVNSELRVIQEQSTPVNHGVTFSGGQRFDLDSGPSLGFVANLGYSRDWLTKEGQQGNASLGPNGTAIQGSQIFDFTSTTETILLNGLLSGGVEWDNHEVGVTGLILRKTQKEARERVGTESLTFGGFDPIVISNLEWFENQVWTTQAYSEHVFPALNDLSISLRGSYSEAFRDAPYETEYLYVQDQNVIETQTLRSAIGLGSGASSAGFDTRFSRVDDQSFGGGIDIELPLVIADRDITLKAGYSYLDNERDYALLSYGFRNETGLPDTDPLFFQRLDFLLSDQNIGETGGFEFVQFPDEFQPSAYRGELQVHGAYFGIDAQLTDFIRAAVGVRYETGEQLVDNFNIAGISELVPNTGAERCEGSDILAESCIDEDYFLPAVTLTWNPLDNVQVRGGFSQTITRPQFQELGAAFFTDTDRDIQIFGNPFLENTEANNFDARIEYYFGRDQFITLGGFYKDLTNPIEESLVASGDNVNVTYINAPSAEIYGLEFEYEQRFEAASIFDFDFLDTKDLVVSANYTWSQSDVSADGTVIAPNNSNVLSPDERPGESFFVDGRSLQGQSDHIANVQIGYEDFEARSRAFILLNWSSERIRQVGLITGGSQVPDTVERLPVTVDFVYSRSFEKWGGDWDMQAKVGNILNDRYEATVDGAEATSVPIDVYDLGTTVSLSLKRRF